MLVVLKCLPFFTFVAIGLYTLLAGLIPSWRTKGWKTWKFYDTDKPKDTNSWSVALGWVKPDKPMAQGEMSTQQAIRVYVSLGALFMLLGLAGTAWILLSTIRD